MKNLLISLSVAVLGTALVGSSAQAQGRGFGAASGGRGGAAFAPGRGARGGASRRNRGGGFFPGSAYAPYYPGYGYASDFGYASDLGFESDDEPMLGAPPPQVIYRQPFRAATPPSPPKPSEGPVLLEVQGDHWVRITSNGPPQIVGPLTSPEAELAANLPAVPSAVLVFRDGHQEEIGKYCIMGSTIHITTDYWSTGSWTRTVHISDLDVPATLKLNQERGTHFRLPSAPYEVMIGG